MFFGQSQKKRLDSENWQLYYWMRRLQTLSNAKRKGHKIALVPGWGDLGRKPKNLKYTHYNTRSVIEHMGLRNELNSLPT